MVTAIHIEIDALCLLILCVIAYQSLRSVSQQMTRVLFRELIYGIIIALVLDSVWMLIDGKLFPGAIVLNKIVNALFLGAGILLGGTWYLYVLETMGYKLTRPIVVSIMLPGLIFSILNVVSIWTGQIFYITEDNVYVRGPLFWLQEAAALLMLGTPLFHILLFLVFHRDKKIFKAVKKLLGFYIVPVIGMLVSLPYTGMPGTWTCAAISVVLIYIDDQEGEILRDSLTGLNNRKTLDSSFTEYVKEHGEGKVLYLYMLDLNRFKQVNDTYGHDAGDQALMAVARVLKKSIANRRCIIARYGGDEFVIMGLFSSSQDAMELKTVITENFQKEVTELPFPLAASIGMTRYQEGMQLQDMVKAADKIMYQEKRGGRGA